MSQGEITILIFLVVDFAILLDHEWQLAGRERNDKSRKSYTKGRKASRSRGRVNNISLVWNELDDAYDNRD